MSEPRWKNKEEYEKWKAEGRPPIQPVQSEPVQSKLNQPPGQIDKKFWTITLKAAGILVILFFVIYMAGAYIKFIYAVTAIAIAALLFLLLREVLLWYWRVNHVIKRFDMIIERLDEILYRDDKPEH